MSIITVASAAPAAGKTTTALAFASYFGDFGAPVLLFDCDPLSDLSEASGRGRAPTLSDMLERNLPLRACAAATDMSRVDIVRASPDLERTLERVPAARIEERLHGEIEMERGRYSYIIVDCPSTEGPLRRGALAAGRLVIVPVPCEAGWQDDVQSMVADVWRARGDNPTRIRLLPTMFDGSAPAQEALAEMRHLFPAAVFATAIPYDPVLEGMLDRGAPFERDSPGWHAYERVAMEVASHVAGVT
jgi:chromosome partitioning protein